ncbi:NAD-dependent succinate-semialdehyde dehydrogenase [Moraxella oblonga]|uniref:NAD-dependent succinate-semialdehyde dehydrogenase n=1 Tax=Moraxella oblonga TaxID=200413 RepID=UPI000829F84E|nr:NAD-dependent succinate-semialdehyde dehydrogenase [Moraxella oblonga]
MKLQNPSLFRERALIDNTWHSAQSGDTIDVFNPFNHQKIGIIPNLSADEVRGAIATATTAQQAWSKKTAHERADILHRWADLIDDNLDDLAIIMTSEQGKPLKESQSEIRYANSFIRFFAEEGKRVYGDTIPAKSTNLRHIVLKEPVGVCACITPWNFPSAMITRKVAPALAVGCAMIVKPDSQTPFSALALGKLAIQAGLPAGILQIVTGQAEMIGEIFSTDNHIKKLSFTGSTRVGKLLMAQSAPTLKKLSLELGGNAPFIIFDDANLDEAINGLIMSKYRNAGQTCVCANRVYVQRGIFETFLEKFTTKVRSLTVGNGMDNPDMACLINEQALQKTQALLSDALAKGATLITGGSTHTDYPTCFLPTIITNITEDMDIAHAEIFAPIAPVFVFDDEEEVIKKANATPYGLASYFYTQNHARAWRVAERLECGMVAQNTGLLSTEVAPFGGIKESGFGREGSKYGLDEYLTIKYWCINME